MELKLLYQFDNISFFDKILWSLISENEIFKNTGKHDGPQCNIWKWNSKFGTIILRELYDYVIATGDKFGIILGPNFMKMCSIRFGRLSKIHGAITELHQEFNDKLLEFASAMNNS